MTIEETSERRPSERRGSPLGRIAVRLAVALGLGIVATLPAWLASNPAAAPEDPTLEGTELEHYRPVGWSLLAGFAYETPEPGSLAELSSETLAARNERVLPAEVRALDGQQVALRGFAIPVEVDVRNDRITRFLLAAHNDLGCCFGVGVGVNEWVLVEVPEDTRVELETFTEATVLGRLSVSEDVERGAVLSLYRMRAERVRTG